MKKPVKLSKNWGKIKGQGMVPDITNEIIKARKEGYDEGCKAAEVVWRKECEKIKESNRKGMDLIRKGMLVISHELDLMNKQAGIKVPETIGTMSRLIFPVKKS